MLGLGSGNGLGLGRRDLGFGLAPAAILLKGLQEILATLHDAVTPPRGLLNAVIVGDDGQVLGGGGLADELLNEIVRLLLLDGDGVIRWSYCSPVGVNPGADGILEALESLHAESTAAEHASATTGSAA